MYGKGTIRALTAILALGAAPAQACQCVLPRDPDARRDFIIERAQTVFSGRVLAIRKIKGPPEVAGDGVIEAEVEVVTLVKGNAKGTVTIRTLAGDNGANCGMGGKVAAAWSSGERLAFALGAGEGKRGRRIFWANSCTSGRFYIPP